MIDVQSFCVNLYHDVTNLSIREQEYENTALIGCFKGPIKPISLQYDTRYNSRNCNEIL